MPLSVFYSVCPFGTGTIETGAGNISITSGVATLTVAQTGNIGVGVAIEYNSLICYIAPNRIAFTSGGTTELLINTKIEGGTSGATGIVRFIEVTSGTWAGGDAAGWIYFESITGSWNASEQINRTKPTSSTNIGTTNGSLEGNIGNGNTQFVVKSAIGGIPANQAGTAVTAIHHEYASLSAFEASFTNASHINNTDLTAADIVAHACCYYDHDNYTADTTYLYIEWGGTTDSTRYLSIYTPVGESESINNQRYSGKWDNNKFNFAYDCADADYQYPMRIGTYNVVIDGLQCSMDIDNSTGSSFIYPYDSASVGAGFTFSNLIIRALNGSNSSNCQGFRLRVASGTYKLYNNIIYGWTSTTDYTETIRLQLGTVDIFYSTISDGRKGIKNDGGSITAKNCAVFNNADDFINTISCDYCASDDADASTYTNGVDWANEATDWANVFNDYANGDFSLNNFTGTGTIIEQGTDLSSSEGIWRDIAGNERGATPCIGAFEYVTTGWTGKFMGVTNPAKINGVAVANISKVMGIA